MAHDEKYRSPPQRLNGLKKDAAFFERNTFTQKSIESLLFGLACSYDVTDKHLELLVAIAEGLRGTHPHMRISVGEIPDGVTPKAIKSSESARMMMAVSDEIDMAVAQGVKQEAAVEDAIQKHKISRREVFRMLKKARAIRVSWKAEEHLLAWPCYEHHEIADDGTLVPTVRNE
ncbi:hypothetical protein MWU38_03570 [Qipengyuania sp. S6317L1]|uniref:hypothetical protein n=1 Tax=Qipengyuania sp. S6317L1 TaxID=2926410 RepID=UPI001FF5E6DC|nr:hypothetical protein [Qipengyuania sp. S6317L1]MCK0098455.1 hypothetical protein [Qipengyuania sp. S6317L1]